MKSRDILFLSSPDVRTLLTLDQCTAAVEHSFWLHGQGKTIPPAVLGFHVPNGGFHIKAGMLPLAQNYFAGKVNANFPDNPARFALPTIQGLIILCDAENGTPLAIVDSREITSLRTAAATAVAAKYLAHPDSRVVTVCGCGIQARAQIAALARIFSLTAVFGYDANPKQSLDFAREVAPQLNVPIAATDDLGTCIRRSDICITCTTSTEAILTPDHARPGIFIAAVGADNPQKQEIHATLMAKSKIVCDVIEQCATMGDLHHALDAAAMTIADVHAELGEVVAGIKPGWESPEEIIIFDSTGMALQDVAATAAVYENALREKTGTLLPLAA